MFIAMYMAVTLAAYLVGSLPTGYLLGKARGIDIRIVGSGNIGATNVFRILGKRAGVFVLLVDFVKGCGSALLLGPVVMPIFLGTSSPDEPERVSIAAGIAAVLGHNYTCWLKFKGGKGIATSAGVLLAWVPAGFAIVLVSWLIVLAVSRYVSLASVVAALVLPLAVWITGSSTRMLIICVFLSLLAIFKHRSNIQRLLRGTEHRIGAKVSETPTR